jgi:ATP-dependent Clp protease ATP-binding subunit ClpC
MPKQRSLRVYFIEHHDRRHTGILMRKWGGFFDRPPPSAYGDSQDAVLESLDTQLRQRELDEDESLERYLWEEHFSLRRVDVDVFPQALVRGRPVIGKKNIPIRLNYAWTELGGGGYQIMLPRFGWWFVLEDLDIAADVLRNGVSTYLLGEQTHSIYDFRQETDEFVVEWSPKRNLHFEKPPSFFDVLEFPNLAGLAEELVQKAFRKRLPPVVSRRPLDSVERELVDRPFPPPLLLVGGSGVGKSTWVRGLAEHYASRRRDKKSEPPPRIWRIPGEQFIAGMVYLGQWQQRVLDIVEELRYEGDYLYVDRLTSIVRPQSDGVSVADLMLPALQAEEISLIAECSESELQRVRERSPGLLSQFRILRIGETPRAQMAALVPAYLARKAPWLCLDPLALKRALRFLAHYQRHLCFPGKGFRFLDWLIEQTGSDETRTKLLLAPDLTEAFSRYSGLPVSILSEGSSMDSKAICDALASRVVGQDEACRISGRVLARFKAGIDDPDKPVGSLFFVGPTGVGKTELSKQLARFLFGDEDRLIRIDMSEHAFPGSAQRLLRTGSGGGSLVEKVRRQPLSVVLLDEIEKAHPEVFDLILGILGEGRLSDALGRLVDFRMTLIVMTSNLGTSDADTPGFGDESGMNFAATVRKHFRPEFFNRLDVVVPFRPLAPADVRRIVDLELTKAVRRTGLTKRRIELRVSPEAMDRLAQLGFHRKRGARPLKRVIEERVMTPIAVQLAGDPETKNREIRVVPEDSEAWRRLSAEERRWTVFV